VRPSSWERHAGAVTGRKLTRAEWEMALPQRDDATRVCTGDLSRVRRGLPGDVPLDVPKRRDQTLALSREGQPDAVMC
jgi:hypothetical protein